MATATSPEVMAGLDTTIRLITPERVAFQYPLAGPFRRSVAYLVDLLVLGLLVLLGSIIAGILSLGSASGSGIILAFCFALNWGYGIFCESVFHGQTAGKRALGIRVVTDQGVPISATQAAVRNIVGTFDGPFPFIYLPGLASMLATRKFQRLGDLAAGTMVVVEETRRGLRMPRVSEPGVEELLAYLPARVAAGSELARALSDYVRHRGRFGRNRREEMAAHLAGAIREQYGLPPRSSGDAVLCALYQRVFHGE